ncbi:hypothetical protein LTR17_027903 [Elasticomyces elasticus]|nr:hypothetical protein LTR17_027903 [Elasticomyces elasticus]
MAEIVGLVIGGASLSALFDQCLSIINYVDSGMHCSDAYQDAALMLTLLGGRLSRWERTYRSTHVDEATEEDGENAGLWLRRIHRRLQEAEKVGERYIADAPAAAPTLEFARSKAVSSLVHRLQDKMLNKADGLSLGKKARWALRDEDKMNGLIAKLDGLITNLEQLFPDLQDQRNQMAAANAAAVIQASDIDAYPEALEALKAAARRVDRNFDVAAASTSNIYRNIEVGDKAMVNNANDYSEEWARAGGAIGKGGGHTYDGIRISGDAKVQNGDMFGGKNVFGA